MSPNYLGHCTLLDQILPLAGKTTDNSYYRKFRISQLALFFSYHLLLSFSMTSGQDIQHDLQQIGAWCDTNQNAPEPLLSDSSPSDGSNHCRTEEPAPPTYPEDQTSKFIQSKRLQWKTNYFAESGSIVSTVNTSFTKSKSS
jgi:hypothetical protein